MNEKDKATLRMSLLRTMEKWCEQESASLEFPWLGENVLVFMADAALAVFVGVADTEEYLKSQGMLPED